MEFPEVLHWSSWLVTPKGRTGEHGCIIGIGAIGCADLTHAEISTGSGKLDVGGNRLDLLPHLDLRAIATRLGLRRRASHQRGVWVAAIAAAWSDPQSASRFWADLSVAAQGAFARLYAAGSMPSALFLAEYGPLRRVGRQRHCTPSPWQRPISPAEELFYSGLLYLDDDTVQVAVDCFATLGLATQSSLLPSMPEVHRAPGPTGTQSLLHDIGQWLVFLIGVQPKLGHGRWLRTADTIAFKRRLCAPPLLEQTHSNDPYLCLLTFLAAAAGLTHAGTVTGLGWRWLALPLAEQLQHLWLSWLTASPELALQYHQPAAPLPPPWPRVLVDHLPPPGHTATAQDLTHALLGSPELAPYLVAHFSDISQLDEAIAATCIHSLAPLGVVTSIGAECDSDRYFATGHFTFAPVDWGAQHPASISMDRRSTVSVADPTFGTANLSIPWNAPAAAQATLALFASYLGDQRKEGVLEHIYQLSEASVAAAAAEDYGLPALLEALSTVADGLPRDMASMLGQWWEAGRRIAISHEPLLRTLTPDLMRRLHEDPVTAPVLGELIAPTTCLLRTTPAAARSALQATGRPVLMAGMGAPVDRPATPAGDMQAAIHPTDEMVAWLSTQLYLALGQHLPLPVPIAQGQLTAWWTALSPAEQAAAGTARTNLLEALHALLDGQSFAPPPQATDPVLWQTDLEDAITGSAWVEVTYFSAGRNLLTRRVIEPYWLETHGGKIYLRGYCHNAARVRLFRLDRIQSLSVLPTPQRPDDIAEPPTSQTTTKGTWR